MITYQDLQKILRNGSEEELIAFIHAAISNYRNSEEYNNALIAEDYAKGKNRTITRYTKLLYTLSGKAVPDNYSANYKMASNFFNIFVIQLNQFLLGNGPVWSNAGTRKALGRDFDIQLQKIGKNALKHGVAYGFWNLDHVEGFTALEFLPLPDEINGSLMSGIRWWQIDTNKPLRATLYEPDGYTEYIWDDEDNGRVLYPKRPYILKYKYSEADGVRIYDGENYPSFPIVPLYANEYHQSEIIGIREQIDAFDLIKSGFANDLDDASQIYWTLQNTGGMDDVDLAQFLRRMKTVKAAVVDDNVHAEAHTIEVPYASREALLQRLEKDMYRFWMALDVQNIAGGATTATQIKAAYEPMNSKADQYEYQVLQFCRGILSLAGIEDEPTFTRSRIINEGEGVQTIMLAHDVLPDDYCTEKVMNILGDGERVKAVLQEMQAQREAAQAVQEAQEQPVEPQEPPQDTNTVPLEKEA